MNWEPIITTSIGVLLLLTLLWVNDKLLTPWQVRRQVTRLLDDIKSGKPSKLHREYSEEVRFDQNGFEMISMDDPDTPPTAMAWPEVERVVAFKLDLFTTDEIRVLLAGADGSGYQLSGDMKGWGEFAEALPVYLPGCLEFKDWIWKVAMPPFKTNETEIFIRDSNPPTQA